MFFSLNWGSLSFTTEYEWGETLWEVSRPFCKAHSRKYFHTCYLQFGYKRRRSRQRQIRCAWSYLIPSHHQTQFEIYSCTLINKAILCLQKRKRIQRRSGKNKDCFSSIHLTSQTISHAIFILLLIIKWCCSFWCTEGVFKHYLFYLELCLINANFEKQWWWQPLLFEFKWFGEQTTGLE